MEFKMPFPKPFYLINKNGFHAEIMRDIDSIIKPVKGKGLSAADPVGYFVEEESLENKLKFDSDKVSNADPIKR